MSDKIETVAIRIYIHMRKVRFGFNGGYNRRIAILVKVRDKA